MLRTPCFAAILAGTVVCLGTAWAQDDPRAKEIESLRQTVQGLEKALEDVRARLAEMERVHRASTATSNAPMAAVPAPVVATPPAPAAVPSSNLVTVVGMRLDLPAIPRELEQLGRSPIVDFDTFNDVQIAAPRPDNHPIEPALVGFITIPGTVTAVRFGGSARLDAIQDFGNNGNPNQFVPSSIPVTGQPGADGGSRSTLEAKGTRISFETRRPVNDTTTLRIYNENDFFGNSASSEMSFRVRHFYGQAWNFLVGQTFSAFMDVDSFPDTVDYAAPNAVVNRRQPQIRYTQPLRRGDDRMHLIFSVEQPQSNLDLTAAGIPAGASSVSRGPDGVLGWRWEAAPGHVQISGIVRSVGYEADGAPDDSVLGWGLNAAGAFNLFKKDKLSWQLAYGHGIARYVNDIGGANLDAAPDAAGNLQPLPVFAAMIGYTHQWSTQFRSTAAYGWVNVDAEPSLGAFAINQTHYTSANLVWQPTKAFRMGLEYLFGFKETENGATGDAHRLDFVLRYDLIR